MEEEDEDEGDDDDDDEAGRWGAVVWSEGSKEEIRDWVLRIDRMEEDREKKRDKG